MKRILALATVLLAVSGFAQTKAKPSITASKPGADDGARVVQLDEQLSGIVDAGKNDCDKMAADLKAWVDKNGKEMQRLREEGMKRTPEQRAEFQKKYGARIQAATGRMNAGIGKCIQNGKVKDALSGLNPPPVHH